MLHGGPKQHVYACALPAEITTAAVAEAVGTLADRHAALRTRIGRENGRLYQCADGPRPALESWDAGEKTADEAMARLSEPGAALVDVTDGPSARFLLVHGTDGVRRLAVVLHGAVADGWSRMIILTELDQLVAGGPALRPVCSLGYLGDLERRWRSTEEYDRRLRYWEHLLGTARPDPVGRPAPPEHRTDKRRTGSRRTQEVGAATVAGLRSRCRDERLSPSAVYLAALVAAAAQLTGAAVVPVCLLTSGRNAEIGTSVGVFANHVPLPVSATVAVRMRPGEVWEIITRALRHEVPLPGLLEKNSRFRDLTSRGIGFQLAPTWPSFRSLAFRPHPPRRLAPRSGARDRPFAAIEISVRQESGSARLDALHDPSRCSDELAERLLDGMLTRLTELSQFSAIQQHARSTADYGKGPRLACP